MSAAVASLPITAAAAAADAVPAAAAAAAGDAPTPAAAASAHSRALQHALKELPALSARLTERYMANAAAARSMFLGQYTQQFAAGARIDEKR